MKLHSARSHDFDIRVIHEGWNTFGIATIALADGTKVERALEHHGQATCVLPYDPVRRMVLLISQTRVGPAFWGLKEDLYEAPAGGLDGEEPEKAAGREALEEAGVLLRKFEPVCRSFSMPSISSECLWLYLAPYSLQDKVSHGGGIKSDGEVIAVWELSTQDLDILMSEGRLTDLKTLVLAQALKLKRPDIFK